ncbi:MAG: efflux RND transporter permease subunit [Planctomycetes bacterium]|nr:efflux RND transporter permease subunit [Planctomycetota bacterium]
MITALVRAAVDNRVAVHLAQLLLVVSGLFAYSTMTREIFPEFTREKIRVTAVYPGAAPEDVEELVTVKLEDALDSVDGIEELESTTQEGVCWVIGKLAQGADMTRTLQEVDRAVAAIPDLPAELRDDPLVQEVKTRFPVITLSIHGDLGELALKDLVRPIKRRMEAIPGVAAVQPSGLRALEWHVEVSPEAALRHRVTLDEVARALQAQNRTVPGGTLERARDEVLIRTRGDTETTEQIEAVVVRADPDGSAVRVGDVARVMPGFERALTYGRFDGKTALNLTALKERDGDILEISRQVRELARKLELPAGVRASVHTDLSIYLNDRLDIMKTNALQGFVLVLASLCLLLHWRMAAIVALGIPAAFLFAFCCMALVGISINMMSLFALILVLGMLVDDAIVVVENIQSRIEEGEAPALAAVNGTRQVAIPVFCTVATTISAFMPMLLTPGEMGQWMWQVPVVVSFCLIASLFECFTVMPVHVVEFGPAHAADPAPWFERIKAFHRRAVDWCLARRYRVLSGLLGLSIVIVTLASVTTGFILFDPFESETYFLNYELPSTASLEESSERARDLERLILALPEDEREASITNVGVSAINVDQADRGGHLGQVVFTLTSPRERARGTEEILEHLREETAKLRGFTKLEFKGLQAGPGGSPIEVALEGDDFAALREAADELAGWLRGIDGVHDVFDDSAPGKSELEVVVDLEAAGALGLTTQAVAQQVRDAFQGRAATSVRRLDEDVDLVVRYPLDDRSRRATLEELWLTTPAGDRVPFRAVASAREGRGLAKIVRGDRRRAVTVFADVDTRRANAIEVTDRLKATFEDPMRRERAIDVKVKGQRREAEQSMNGMLKAFLISVLLVYLILGTQFKSFAQPLLVMVAIPFGIDGILLGHMLLGRDVSFMSVMGLVATSGIVVNDSLVLVSLINELRRGGRTALEAASQASVRRLRAIILTSVTTIFGLFPLAFLATGQARFLSPMAISIVFGLAFSTGLTLVVIPCLYVVLEDVKAALGLGGAHEA